MSTELNNIAVAFEPSDSDVLLSLTIHGNLSHQDYVHLILMLDAVSERADHRPINVLVDITDLQGWILDTAWDDLQLGLQHRREFKKIAIIGNQNWQQMLSKVGDWFITGDVHYFEDKDVATVWLNEVTCTLY